MVRPYARRIPKSPASTPNISVRGWKLDRFFGVWVSQLITFRETAVLMEVFKISAPYETPEWRWNIEYVRDGPPFELRFGHAPSVDLAKKEAEEEARRLYIEKTRLGIGPG